MGVFSNKFGRFSKILVECISVLIDENFFTPRLKTYDRVFKFTIIDSGNMEGEGGRPFPELNAKKTLGLLKKHLDYFINKHNRIIKWYIFYYKKATRKGSRRGKLSPPHPLKLLLPWSMVTL